MANLLTNRSIASALYLLVPRQLRVFLFFLSFFSYLPSLIMHVGCLTNTFPSSFLHYNSPPRHFTTPAMFTHSDRRNYPATQKACDLHRRALTGRHSDKIDISLCLLTISTATTEQELARFYSCVISPSPQPYFLHTGTKAEQIVDVPKPEKVCGVEPGTS